MIVMTMTTIELVEKYFQSVNNGDWEEWLLLFDKNIVFTEPIGTVNGIENLGKAVEGLKTGYRTFRNELLEVFVDGNRAVARTKINAMTMSDVPINVLAANFYTVENGKIVSQENIFDAQKLKPFLDQKT